MPDNLTPFVFDDALVRVHTDGDGNPWFVAKDVCRVLEINNHNDAVSSLDDDEKGVATTDPLSSGGSQQVRIVSESGLYSLIFRSRKPEARRFRKWVTGEVLPVLRKTGAYVAPGATLPDSVKRLKASVRVSVLGATMQAARLTNLTTQAEIDALYLHYCAMIADAPDSVRVRLPGMPLPHDVTAENIRRFIDECLVVCRGNRLRAADAYLCFRNWWRGQFDAALPTQKSFGNIMSDVHDRYRRGGTVWYGNVAFKEES